MGSGAHRYGRGHTASSQVERAYAWGPRSLIFQWKVKSRVLHLTGSLLIGEFKTYNQEFKEGKRNTHTENRRSPNSQLLKSTKISNSKTKESH